MAKPKYLMNRGFTLLELMVAITILGILAVTGIGAFSGSFGRARDSKASEDIRAISNALEIYYTVNNEYPTTLEELVSDPDEPDRYLKSGKLPLDKATDEPYMFKTDSDLGYCVCSYKLEHTSGAGSNAILADTNFTWTVSDVTDEEFATAPFTCDNVIIKDVGEGDHYCALAAQ